MGMAEGRRRSEDKEEVKRKGYGREKRKKSTAIETAEEYILLARKRRKLTKTEVGKLTRKKRKSNRNGRRIP